MRKHSEGRIISEEGFLNYYASISATIPVENNNFFSTILINCWELNS